MSKSLFNGTNHHRPITIPTLFRSSTLINRLDIEHPISVRYHIPHGLCCAILLPAVMRFNESVVAEKYAQLTAVVGEPIIPWTYKLFGKIVIPPAFAEYTIPQEDIEPIV
ncbi:MAG: iron-containing alcohol dehydrogenase [bacterium]